MNTKRTPGSASAADGVDAADRGAGERAAHEARVQHPRQRDVVDEGAVAGEQPRVLDPRRRACPTYRAAPASAPREASCRSRELRGPAAVDGDDRAADERRPVRREERRDLGHLLGLDRRVRSAAFSRMPGVHSGCAPMISVWMKPGQIAVDADAVRRRTRPPPALVTAITPAFAAEYTLVNGDALRPPIDDQLTIAPPSPCSSMARMPCFMPSSTPRRSTSIVRVVVLHGDVGEHHAASAMPATLHTTSTRPNSSTAARTIASTSASLRDVAVHRQRRPRRPRPRCPSPRR